MSLSYSTKKSLANHFHGPGGGLEVLQIAIPLFISQASETVMMFTDRLFLSKLGPEQMSAAMGGGIASFLFVTFFTGLIGYSTAMVAQRFGANRSEKCTLITSQSLLVSLIAYPIILSFIPLAKFLFVKTGISSEQLTYQIPYFQILMYGNITLLMRNSVSSFFSGIGKTRIIMIANMAGMVFNVGINYVLIFGKFGFPKLGIHGAGYGTVISGVISLLILFTAYFRKSNRQKYGVSKSFHFSKILLKELLHFGYPAGLEFFLNQIGFTLMIMAFHSQGTVVATAVTIAFNWDMVSFIPLIGVNIAVTSLVGRYVGARDLETAHRSTISALKMILFYSILLLIPFVFFTETMVSLFLPAEDSYQLDQIHDLAVFMVRLIALYIVTDAIFIVFSGALRGAGDTFWTMVISVSMHLMFALSAFGMFFIFGASAKTTWIVIIILFVMFGPVLYLRYRSGHWKKKLLSGSAEDNVSGQTSIHTIN